MPCVPLIEGGTRMRTGRPIPPLTLTADERDTLERWARRPTTAQALAERARVILGCRAGKSNTVVARELRLTKQTVGKWRTRFLSKRLDGLLDEPRPGAPRRISDAHVERVDAGDGAPRSDALEHPRDGAAVWAQPDSRQSNLARVRPATAPGGDVQAVQGPAVHRESAGYRREIGRAHV